MAKKSQFLTFGTIRVIAKEYKYIRFRYADGNSFAINSKAIFIGKNAMYPSGFYTPYVSWTNITFMQYITEKAQIIKYK